MKVNLLESEKNDILSMYGIQKTPFEIIKELKISKNGKYAFYDEKVYDTSNGEEISINEQYNTSDIAHTVADFASLGADMIIPGSGAIIDVLNGISYFIEAEYTTNYEDADMLELMGTVTLAFALIPGPLQGMSSVIKRAFKTGGEALNSSTIAKAMHQIKKYSKYITENFPKLLQKALNSKIGQRMFNEQKRLAIMQRVNKYSTKIINQLNKYNPRFNQTTKKWEVLNPKTKKMEPIVPKSPKKSLIPSNINYDKVFLDNFGVTKGKTLSSKVGKLFDPPLTSGGKITNIDNANIYIGTHVLPIEEFTTKYFKLGFTQELVSNATIFGLTFISNAAGEIVGVDSSKNPAAGQKLLQSIDANVANA
jgi:hypothetical protein